MGEEVALEFAADVEAAVASVRELTGSAQALAGEAKAAADGCAELTASAAGTADAVKGTADSTGAAAASLTAYSDEAKSAAGAAGDLALAQANLKVASADAKAAVAELAAVQATAGKDSTEYAAQLDAVAAAMGRESAAAAQLKGVQAEAAAASTAAGDAQEAAAAKTGTAGEAAAAGGLAKYKMALVGVGIGAAVAVDAAVKFQGETTRLVTSAGESASSLDKVRQGMLAVSSQTGTSTAEMAAGMYTVESAGYHGANGLVVLKAAAQGAKDEGANLKTVANGVTDALVDYHLPASDAANVTSQLITAVSHGKTTFEEFSGSMSNVLPLASAMHLGLADVSGVLAEMTAHGMSALQASQDEANAMRELMKPNAAMVKEFKALGISAQEVYQSLGQRGLAGTMQWLSGIARDGSTAIGQNYTQALGKLMGTAPGLVTALMVSGENAKATGEAIKGIGSASADAQGNVIGFSEVSQTAAFKLSAAKESAAAMGIALGEALLPAVMAVIGPITHFLQMIASNKTEAYAFAVVIGGILAGAIGLKLAGALKDAKEGIKAVGEAGQWLIGKLVAMTTAQEAQTVATEAATVAQGELDVAESANPIGLIIIAIIALIAVIVLVVTHLHFFANAFDIVRHAVAIAGHDIAEAFDVVRHAVAAAGHDIESGFDTVRHAVSAFGHDFVAALEAVVKWVTSHWKEIVAWLVDPIGMTVFEIRTHTHEIAQTFDDLRHDVAAILAGLRHDISAAWDGARHEAAAIVDGWLHDTAASFDTLRHDAAAVLDWIPQEVATKFDQARHDAAAAADAIVHDVASSWDTFRHDTAAVIDAVVGFFQQLPGKVIAQLAALPGEMLAIGKNVITGLINGIVSAAAAIPSIMGQLASDVASYFTNPLKLFSPSRLFFEHGYNIVQGAINGVKANAGNLLATMRDLGGGVGTQGIGAAGAVGPAGGSTSVHVTAPLTVQAGSGYDTPQFQQYLQAAMQEATLRYGQLNANNGLTPAWGR